ncbi:hypothetical protein FHX12_004238 [Rhizobium sp. BK609]|nr:hypothetical protein [Rhizobium sp. BK098]MBB3617245.1 hypothetical protein [Rhizobium sp. BK609]MBB3682919.1 hypothetical protein [Rhizobium sp. BK612]
MSLAAAIAHEVGGTLLNADQRPMIALQDGGSYVRLL